MLIIVALLVFYNEVNSKMNMTEYILLFISLIAIVRAALNYIKFDTIKEGFTTNVKKDKFKNIKVDYEADESDDEDTMIVNSFDSKEYLDSDEEVNDNSNSFTSTETPTINPSAENEKSTNSIKEVNDLLGISSSFTDIPIPTTNTNDDEIKSIFSPKVIIGKGKGYNYDNDNDEDNGFGSNGNRSNWNSAFNNDGFSFNNTMNPVNNLWRDNQAYYTSGGYGYGGNGNGGNGDSCGNNMNNGISSEQWSQSMDSFNRGKWQRNQYNRPSDYVDYISPSGYGTTTPNSPSSPIYGNTSPDSLNPNENSSPQDPASSNDKRKLCGAYTDLDENNAGDLVVKDYTQSKKWVAGYTYVPPIHWDVPQKRAPVCHSATPNVRKLTGLIDRGLPINALELTKDGYIADTEETVNLSSVGSMIPKFNYQEQPFSKPYV